MFVPDFTVFTWQCSWSRRLKYYITLFDCLYD